MPQKPSPAVDNAVKELKHGYFIIGSWNIHRSVHLLFKYVHTWLDFILVISYYKSVHSWKTSLSMHNSTFNFIKHKIWEWDESKFHISVASCHSVAEQAAKIWNLLTSVKVVYLNLTRRLTFGGKTTVFVLLWYRLKVELLTRGFLDRIFGGSLSLMGPLIDECQPQFRLRLQSPPSLVYFQE